MEKDILSALVPGDELGSLFFEFAEARGHVIRDREFTGF